MRPDSSVLGGDCKPHEYWLAEPVQKLFSQIKLFLFINFYFS